MSARAALAAAVSVMALLGLYASFSRRGPEAEAPRPTASLPSARVPPEASPIAQATAEAPRAEVAPLPSAARSDEELLRELEQLSVTDKPRALSLALAEDERLSPFGVMAEARRALIVTLMVDLGRMPDARARAREFMRSYPDSRYSPLVQGVTGIHPRPRPSELRDAR
jgi:hypothetical protein